MSDKPGPFLCEWCSTPLETLKRTMKYQDNPNLIVGIGYCRKCGGEVWSKPVAAQPAPAQPEGSVKG